MGDARKLQISLNMPYKLMNHQSYKGSLDVYLLVVAMAQITFIFVNLCSKVNLAFSY